MAEEKLSPISAAKPPVASPLGAAKPVSPLSEAKPSAPATGQAPTLKLKPVIRKPGAPGAAAPTLGAGVKLPVKPVVRAAVSEEAPKSAPAPAPAPAPAAPKPQGNPLDQLKSVTQRLKGVTQEIPQQAILRKTGIISDQAMTEAQKQASKARTARISLSDAMGVAPVKEGAPMKTIRIKRPVDLPTATNKPAAPAPAPAPAPAAEAPKAEDAAPTLTQRKTLKISRPGGAVKPTAKFGVKKPGAPAPAAAGAAPAAAEGGDVADIPDIPDLPATPAPAPAANTVGDVPAVVGVISLIVQIAACVVMGALGYFLYLDVQASPF